MRSSRLRTVADYKRRYGIKRDDRLSLHLDDIKTIGHFTRVLRRAVLDFYRKEIDAFEFLDTAIALVEDQYRRAWSEGMRAIGMDPVADMIPAWEKVLRDRTYKDIDYLLPFASDIEQAGAEGTPIDPLYSRVDIWSNRYNEVVNLAKITTGNKIKLEWRLGKTERHCSTCSRLNGVVDYSFSWLASGYKPQAAPNPLLECGGWLCDCRLIPTKKRRTRGGVPKV
jgi:hypothetical protein